MWFSSLAPVYLTALTYVSGFQFSTGGRTFIRTSSIMQRRLWRLSTSLSTCWQFSSMHHAHVYQQHASTLSCSSLTTSLPHMFTVFISSHPIAPAFPSIIHPGLLLLPLNVYHFLPSHCTLLHGALIYIYVDVCWLFYSFKCDSFNQKFIWLFMSNPPNFRNFPGSNF